MPHTPEEKQHTVARIRRIKGQLEALERGVTEGDAPCGATLQQIAAVRGAVNGLMAEVLEMHLRGAFGTTGGEAVEDAIALVRSYLK